MPLERIELSDGTCENIVVHAVGQKINATVDFCNNLGISRVEKLTQAAYDAIETPDDTTLYLIVG